MIKEYYLDLQDDTGQIGITGVRCTSCGEVIGPVKQRKYAQRVDRDMLEGQDRNGHGSDKKHGD